MKKSNQFRRALKFILLVTFISIPLSGAFDTATVFLEAVPWYFGIFIVIFIVFIGAFFDMIGVAAAAAEEPPFHAMASKRVFGAKMAVKIVRNAERVASVCSDVIGDIAGVLSGATALAVGEQIAMAFGLKGWAEEGVSIALTVLATALTIGAKALGKTIAVYFPTPIVLMAAKVLESFLNRKKPQKINRRH